MAFNYEYQEHDLSYNFEIILHYPVTLNIPPTMRCWEIGNQVVRFNEYSDVEDIISKIFNKSMDGTLENIRKNGSIFTIETCNLGSRKKFDLAYAGYEDCKSGRKSWKMLSLL